MSTQATMGYFTSLTIAFADGSVESIPHRNICSISYDAPSRTLTILSENGNTVNFAASKDSAENIMTKHSSWNNVMNSDISSKAFIPNFQQCINEEIQLKLGEGMDKILHNLDTIIGELAAKSKTVSDIADTFITITKGKS